jgi:hypothetical protein
VFGVGTLVYFVQEAVTLRSIDAGSKCVHPVFVANIAFAMIFVILQTAFVLAFPRLNLHSCPIIVG